MSGDTINITYPKAMCNEVMEMLLSVKDREKPREIAIYFTGEDHLFRLPMKSVIAAQFGTTKGIISGKTKKSFLVINRDGGRDIIITCK